MCLFQKQKHDHQKSYLVKDRARGRIEWGKKKPILYEVLKFYIENTLKVPKERFTGILPAIPGAICKNSKLIDTVFLILDPFPWQLPE